MSYPITSSIEYKNSMVAEVVIVSGDVRLIRLEGFAAKSGRPGSGAVTSMVREC